MNRPGEATDAELAAKAAAGEEHAFTLLMRRHKGAIYRFARRYTGQDEDAFEIVQETFVSAWAALRRYDGERPLGVWLRAIALNKCRDRGRRAAVRRMIFGPPHPERDESPSSADPSPSAERSLIDRERLAALDRALAALPAQLKEPLILTVLEGLPQAEAATLLGVNAKAVETRVYRARKRLAAALAALDRPMR